MLGGVPVQAAAGPVIPHRGARVRMGGCFLDVAQRHSAIQTGGDEGVSQRVGKPSRISSVREVMPSLVNTLRRW
jgi:hypothetical protein